MNRIALFMFWPGATKELYDSLRKEVNWEGDTPTGAVLHVASFDSAGAHMCDVWESKEDFDNFLQNRLMPGVQKLQIPGQPDVKIYPLHQLFTPGV